MISQVVSDRICFHCHDEIKSEPLVAENHHFCCNGCKQVYLLLSTSNLGNYYQEGIPAGIKPSTQQFYFEQFDLPELRNKWISFEEGFTTKVELHLPQIHCASCIYLLEHLHKLNSGIQFSVVNFPKKLATIVYDNRVLKLSEVAQLLTKIGYTPDFSENVAKRKTNKRLLYQLGVAGFAFGSIMLWSFPEYLKIDYTYKGIRNFSSWLSFLVSIPVLFYSAQDYFKAALGGIRTKSLNLDIPIVIGIIALYLRSCYAIFTNEGPGYMDSFSGFIFFLLIGKWFQSKTYEWLAFDRDYKSYFPVAILKKTNDLLQLTPIEELDVNDRIFVRNDEIVPTDSVLISPEAFVDYSFVSGEAEWVKKSSGDTIYAGGKICENAIELEVLKKSNRSNLVSLWNNTDAKTNDQFVIRQDRISKKFILAMLLIAATSAIVWSFIQPSAILGVITSVLIVACPCALALSGPFTFGNMIRKLGKHGFYLRSTTVLEKLQQVDTIVFDKTGTLSEQASMSCSFTGDKISQDEAILLLQLTEHAVHPYSKAIHEYLRNEILSGDYTRSTIIATEIAGKGIELGNTKIGSASFCSIVETDKKECVVYWTIEDKLRGTFYLNSKWRAGLDQFVSHIGKKYPLVVLSGDKNTDESILKHLFPQGTTFYFDQTPTEKKHVIQHLQENGSKVLMIGDGLNDAGALKAAFSGVALSDDLVRFTPASDAILKGEHLIYLNDFLEYINKGKSFLRWCFAFSLCYNLTGIAFAVSNSLTPFVAAVIMPLSSITVVALATWLSLKPLLPGKVIA